MTPMIGLSRTRATLLVIDLQDRLVGALPTETAGQVTKNTAILIEAAGRLGLPVVVSQQYPRGLGVTIPAIEDALRQYAPDAHRFDKLELSAARTPELTALARAPGRDQWILAGIEAHVCVYQTARDLAARGHQVHVATDAIGSRTKANWRVGIDLIGRAGAIATSTEVCVFDLLGRAGSEDFKALSKAIK